MFELVKLLWEAMGLPLAKWVLRPAMLALMVIAAFNYSAFQKGTVAWVHSEACSLDQQLAPALSSPSMGLSLKVTQTRSGCTVRSIPPKGTQH